jgi:hypothetical protein
MLNATQCTGGSSGFCGDGVVNTGETCDGTNFTGLTCVDFSFVGGPLGCTSNCQINTTDCLLVDNEAPKYYNLSAYPASPAPYVFGQNYTFNVTWIDNGGVANVWINFSGTIYPVVNFGGDIYSFNLSDLAVSRYYYIWFANDSSGNLNQTDLFDYAVPSANCGDGMMNPGEQCDGTNITVACTDIDQYTGGTLSCDVMCMLNATQCTGGSAGVCGDGTVNAGETCDGTNFTELTCLNFSFLSGPLGCTSNCEINTTNCPTGTYCGDGSCNGGELCSTCPGDCGGCGGGCSDQCPKNGTIDCDVQGRVRICGNYDSDDCLEWNSWDNCPDGQTCYEDSCCGLNISVSCEEWTNCTDNLRTRECISECDTNFNETGICCSPEWSCTNFGDCENGTQMRTCTDLHNCSTDEGKPDEWRGCVDSCHPRWVCEPWSECTYVDKVGDVITGDINYMGLQQRLCVDHNGCRDNMTEYKNCTSDVELEFVRGFVCDEDTLKAINKKTGLPVTLIDIEAWKSNMLDVAFIQASVQYCASCYNGIKDGNEQGIDCGGDGCRLCRPEHRLWYWLNWILWVLAAILLIPVLKMSRDDDSLIAEIRRLIAEGTEALKSEDRKKAADNYRKIKWLYVQIESRKKKKMIFREIMGYYKKIKRFFEL